MNAESAKSILDKAAATVSNPSGVQANFQMISKQFGSTSGTISVKGHKFHASTPQAIVWFDGKTQWTYMKGNDEVNISNPTEAQLQAINPYNFINIYKKGFKLSAKEVENSYEVHLVPNKKEQKIQEMYIIVDKASYHPTHVKMKQKDKWSTIIISQLKTATLSDGLFQFNSKDFPKAEIIDLR
jgi:outer membrane lipoprotein-sorting protein